MGVFHGGSHARADQPSGAGGAIAADEDAIDILLVEDSYGDALLMLQALNAADIPYTISRIDNGDDVLPYLEKAAQEKMPDVIFLDMELPGTNGFEILERLAASRPPLQSVPIILVSAPSNFTHLKDFYDLPIQGHLTKSVNAESVKTLLSDIFGEAGRKKRGV